MFLRKRRREDEDERILVLFHGISRSDQIRPSVQQRFDNCKQHYTTINAIVWTLFGIFTAVNVAQVLTDITHHFIKYIVEWFLRVVFCSIQHIMELKIVFHVIYELTLCVQVIYVIIMDLYLRKSSKIPLIMNIVNFILSVALTIAVLVMYGEGNVCSKIDEIFDPDTSSFANFPGCQLKLISCALNSNFSELLLLHLLLLDSNLLSVLWRHFISSCLELSPLETLEV